MSQFSKIGIVSKPDDQHIANTVQSLYLYLSNRSVEIYADEVSANLISQKSINSCTTEEIAHNCNLVVAIGGDGTLLHAAHSLIEKDIPLLGINLGHLGFLAEISPSDIEHHLEKILQGEYNEEQRFALQASLIREDNIISTSNAVNDVVVHALQIRMIEIETRVNSQHLNTLRADGYIVATPTGSTAYSLSGGGPILHPNLDAIVLVPICPHTLSNRPIVVDANSQIELLLSTHNNHPALASIDGQINMDFLPGDTLKIQKGTHALRLIQPKHYNYFEMLREKLRWSTPPNSKRS